MSWADLNERYRHYLQTIYEVDQKPNATKRAL